MIDIDKLPIDTRYQIGMRGNKVAIAKDETDRYQISQFHKCFQQKLNYLKQLKMIEITNKIFKNINDNRHQSVKNNDLEYLLTQKPTASYFCNLSLKELGITKREIITTCIER